MLRRKVRMASGLFDRTSPSYHRAKFRFDGLTPDTRRDEPTQTDWVNRAELAAIAERREYLRTPVPVPVFDDTPRLVRSSNKRRTTTRFVNRPIWG